METKFEIGDRVKCKKFASLTHDFIGTIEKIYENQLLQQSLLYHVLQL